MALVFPYMDQITKYTNMTRSALSLTLFLIAINGLFAQQEDRFSYGLYLTPKTSFVFFEDNDLGDYSNTIGINTQLVVNYQLSDKFAVSTGIKYTIDRFSTIDYSPRLGCDFNGNSFDLYSSWFTNEFTIQYLGVPLEGRYYFKRQGNRLYVKLGYEYFFKTGESRDAFLVACGINETPLASNIGDEAKNYSTKINFGIGWEVASNGRSVLTLEPEAAYSTLPVYEEAGIVSDFTNNVRLLDLGLRLGVTF
jgi:hypothetical protein